MKNDISNLYIPLDKTILKVVLFNLIQSKELQHEIISKHNSLNIYIYIFHFLL